MLQIQTHKRVRRNQH